MQPGLLRQGESGRAIGAATLLGLAAATAMTVFVATMGHGSAGTATENCHRKHGAIAETICGSAEYLAMDREIAALTDRAMTQFSPDDQRRLGQSELNYYHQRQGCEWAAHHSAHPGAAVDECLRARMEGRVKALRVMVDRGRF